MNVPGQWPARPQLRAKPLPLATFLVAGVLPAGVQGIAPHPIAGDMIPGYSHQPECLPPVSEQALEERAFGEPAEPFVAHEPPRRASMLAA